MSSDCVRPGDKGHSACSGFLHCLPPPERAPPIHEAGRQRLGQGHLGEEGDLSGWGTMPESHVHFYT